MIEKNNKNIIKIKKYSPFNYRHWVEKGFSQQQAKYQVKIRRPSNIQYWLNKGFSQQQSKEKLFEQHSHGLNYYIKKYGRDIGIQKHQQIVKKIKTGSKRSTQYWLNKAFSQQQSRSKVSDTQRRDLQYYVNKYGKNEGKKRFQSRNKKWNDAMKSKSQQQMKIINKKKNVNDFNKINENRSKQQAIQFMVSKYKKQKQEVIKKILICQSKEQLYSKFKKLNIQEIEFVLGSKYILDKFNISNNDVIDIKVLVYKYNNIDWFSNVQYGKRIKYNGDILKSDGEYKIAKYLKQLNIKYIYQKKYKNNIRKKTDFYLPKYDVHIQYLGMMNIQTYRRNAKLKKKIALQNNISVFFSSSVQQIKNYIRKLNEEKS